MRIEFMPVRRDGDYSLIVNGDTLTIDGEGFDFSNLSEGDELPGSAIGSDWIVGATRESGEVVVRMMLPHSATAPQERRFPETININSGEVNLPSNEVTE